MSNITPDMDIIHACYLACTNWEYYEGMSVSEVSNERDAEFDRWLAEVKAQVWEEGTLACLDTHHLPVEDSKLPRNPYRQGEAE